MRVANSQTSLRICESQFFYSHLISSLSNICSYMCNFCVMYMLHLFDLCYATMRAGARLCVCVCLCVRACNSVVKIKLD